MLYESVCECVNADACVFVSIRECLAMLEHLSKNESASSSAGRKHHFSFFAISIVRKEIFRGRGMATKNICNDEMECVFRVSAKLMNVRAGH